MEEATIGWLGVDQNDLHYTTEQANELTNSLKGKLVLCYTNKKSLSRHFIRRFSVASDIIRKEGWWDTFTISKEDSTAGFGLFEIDYFRIDKNGYLNLIVKFVKEISDATFKLPEKYAWSVLLNSGRFADPYIYDFTKGRELNYKALISVYNNEIDNFKVDDSTTFYQKVGLFFLHRFYEDKISFKEIAEKLIEPFEYEMVLHDIIHSSFTNEGKYIDKYPLIYKKVCNFRQNNNTFYEEELFEYIDNLNVSYMNFNREKGIDVEYISAMEDIFTALDHSEFMLEYYKNEKDASKEASKEERKAKRKAMKEQQRLAREAKHQRALEGRNHK